MLPIEGGAPDCNQPHCPSRMDRNWAISKKVHAIGHGEADAAAVGQRVDGGSECSEVGEAASARGGARSAIPFPDRRFRRSRYRSGCFRPFLQGLPHAPIFRTSPRRGQTGFVPPHLSPLPICPQAGQNRPVYVAPVTRQARQSCQQPSRPNPIDRTRMTEMGYETSSFE